MTICYSIDPPLNRPSDHDPSYGYKSPANMLLNKPPPPHQTFWSWPIIRIQNPIYHDPNLDILSLTICYSINRPLPSSDLQIMTHHMDTKPLTLYHIISPPLIRTSDHALSLEYKTLDNMLLNKPSLHQTFWSWPIVKIQNPWQYVTQ